MARGVYERIGELVRTGRRFVFCSIVNAKGSTPRKTGAVMAVLPDGETIGSVGGGKAEYECIRTAGEMLAKLCTEAGGETNKGFHDGGHMVADRNGKPEETGRKAVVLHFDMNIDRTDGDYICGGEMDIELRFVSGEDTALGDEILGIVRKHRRRKAYIFGGGHVAQALVPILAGVEFAPVVYEEREEFADRKLFPEAEDIICHGFDRLAERISIEETDYCVIMTKGHSDDYTVLKQVLGTNAEYTGLMGSRAKRAVLFERLRADGFTEENIARIHNPIGIAIGSETPAEIAVSIAAEMIAVRAESIKAREAAEAGAPESEGEKTAPQEGNLKRDGRKSPYQEETAGKENRRFPLQEGDPEKEHWGEVAELFARKAGIKPEKK